MSLDADQGTLYKPRLPKHWARCRLLDMAKWTNGRAFRSVHLGDTGLPVIKIAELKNGLTGQTKYTAESFEEAYLVRPGDLLFSWSGQPETSIDVFWWRGPEGWLNQHIFKVVPREDIDRTFFYYLLKYLKPHFVRIARNKQTTGLGHITRQDLGRIEAGYPTLREQQAIARVLGTLDDKIEQLRRMNETLEAIARTIFKSWFVDFDPVIVNALRAGNPIPETFAARAAHYRENPAALGLPADILGLFAERFEESEHGPIPAGWRVQALDELARFQNGLALQRYRPEPGEERLPVVKIAQLRSGRPDSGEWASASIRKDCILEDGDVVMSWSGSLLLTIWCGGRAALNQHLFKVTSDRFPKWFYYHWIDQHLPEFVRIAADRATTMGHIKRHHLSDAKCVVPDDRLLALAGDRIETLLERRIAATLEAGQLAAVRDVLLPRLISGELRIPDAERILEESA